MKKWTRLHTLVAGIVLILATNAVALLGVAYNRSEPESTLKLTERELALPYNWGFEKENSGIALVLRWRMLPRQDDVRFVQGTSYAYFRNAPAWLDRDKLAALGFDVSRPEDTPQGRMFYDKTLPKEVLLVLELDGPAYRTALARIQRHLQEEQALLKKNPGNKEFQERVKNAARELYQEERVNSRLFVVDADSDAASARVGYPDRHRYAIVRGKIQPQLVDINHKPRLTGFITGLSVSEVNVPANYRPIFEPLRRNERTNQYGVAATPFEVSVAFGKRFEPWITGAKGSK